MVHITKLLKQYRSLKTIKFKCICPLTNNPTSGAHSMLDLKTLEHFQNFLDLLGLHSLPKLVLPSSMSLSTIYTPVTLKSDL